MIVKEKLTIDGKSFVKTYSDTSYVVRNGVLYAEAIDPENTGRVYTESETPLPDLTAEEALEIIMGGAQ